MGEVKIVADYIIGRFPLGVKRELPFISFFEFSGVPAARGAHPLQPKLVWHIDENQSITILIELALKQQRAVFDNRDDLGRGLMQFAFACTTLMDARVDDRFQFTQLGGVCKDDAPQRRAFDVTRFRHHGITPPLTHLRFHAVEQQCVM